MPSTKESITPKAQMDTVTQKPSIEARIQAVYSEFIHGQQLAGSNTALQPTPRNLDELMQLSDSLGDDSSISKQVALLGICSEHIVQLASDKYQGHSIDETDLDFTIFSNQQLRELLIDIDDVPIKTTVLVEQIARASLMSERDMAIFKKELESMVTGMWHEQNLVNFITAHTDIDYSEATHDEDKHEQTDITLHLVNDKSVKVNVKSSPEKVLSNSEVVYVISDKEKPVEVSNLEGKYNYEGEGSKPAFVVGVSHNGVVYLSMDIGGNGAPIYANSLKFDDKKSTSHNRLTGFNLHEFLVKLSEQILQ